MQLTPAGVALQPPLTDGAPFFPAAITVAPYGISPGYDLHEWVQMQSRNGEHPSVQNLSVTFVATALMPFAAVGDQVVYAIADSPLLHTETVWIAKEGFVVQVSGFSHPEYHAVLAQIAASLTLDAARLAEKAAQGAVAGDETALRTAMGQVYPLQLEAAEAAIRNSDPPAPLSVTVIYTGTSIYGTVLPPFVVRYDPELWTLVPGEGDQGAKLEHRKLATCVLDLRGGATETLDPHWRQLGKQWWVQSRLGQNIISYNLPTATAGYIFTLTTPPAGSVGADQPCRLAAEQVLNTFATEEAS